MTRVLLTGATGFVGRQIMRALAKADAKLVPVVRMGKENLVADLPNVERVISTTDIFSEGELWWAKQCQGVDTIIHAAWYAEPGKYLQSSKNVDCLTGSINLVRGAMKAGVNRFVGIGTCVEYDLANDILSVDTPLKPITPYAASKAALFLTLSQWLPTQLMGFAWCRLFYLYGDGEDERRLVPYIRKQLQSSQPAELTSGKQIRDFLDVIEAGRKLPTLRLVTKPGL